MHRDETKASRDAVCATMASSESPSAPAAHPSVALAQALKVYGDREYKPLSARLPVVAWMVVGFDKDLFVKQCNPASDEYDASVDFDLLAAELFKEEEIWVSRDLLMAAMQQLAMLHGFQVKCEKESIMCNRSGEAKSSRNYHGGVLQAECPFEVKMKCLERERYLPTPTATRYEYRDQWSRPVKIKVANCAHGGRCTPSRQNRIMTVQRSGKYVQSLPDTALFTLCNHLEHNGKLESAYIKSVLRPILPKAKNVTKHDVFNTRVKVMRLLPTFRKTNGEYEAFKEVANANDLLGGIDNVTALNDDEACRERLLSDSCCGCGS